MKIRMKTTAPRQAAGFTLLELLVVLVIVAILGTIAYPSYIDSVRKSKRADARTQLMEASQYMQRYYSQNDRFDQSNADTPVANALPSALATVPRGAASGTQDYTIGFQAGTLTARSYTLEAVPRAGSLMATDNCGTLRLDSVGRKTVNSAIVGEGMSADKCWR